MPACRVPSTFARFGITTIPAVNHVLLKCSISALASGMGGCYVCIVRLIDARQTNILKDLRHGGQHPKEKPTNQVLENHRSVIL